MRRRTAAIALALALSAVSVGAGTIAYADVVQATDAPATTAAVSAQSSEDDFVIEDGVLYDYTGTATDIVIPDGVTEIYHWAFEYKTVTSVTFPDSVRKIDYGAFPECQAEEIILPPHLEELGDAAFWNCPNLKHVWIPASLKTTIPYGTNSTVSNGPFWGFEGTVTFEEGATVIPEGLFLSTTLESVIIPDTVTDIQYHAFWHATLGDVVLPRSLETISDYAFSSSTIDSLTVASVGSFTGSVDAYSIGSVTFEEGVTSIPDGFLERVALGELSFPSTLKSIGVEAFTGRVYGDVENDRLTTVNIPDSVTSLGANAFSSRYALTSVHIPGSLQEVTGDMTYGLDGPFYDCTRLTDVTFGEGISVIPDALLSGTGIERLVLPSTVTSIGEYAFADCISLEMLSIPSSVTSIDRWTFGAPFGQSDEFFIHCEPGSEAESFADAYDIPYSYDINHEHTDEWFVDREPTCLYEGLRSYRCECGLTKDSEAIPALGHDFTGEWVVDVKPTCTEPGSGSRHCTRCDVLSEEMEIPALGHDLSEEWVVDVAPTCTEEGERSHHCERVGCDAREDIEAIPALGHDYGDWVTDVEPTCTEPGERSKHCSRCDDRADVEPVPALGHDFGEWVVDAPATYFQEGAQHRVCKRCDTREDEVIPKLVPDFDAHPDYTFAKLSVVDAQTLEAIDGAAVTVTNDAGEKYELTTEQGGQAALFVPAGTYYLTIEKSGYQIRGFEYTFEAGNVDMPQIGISTESLVQGDLTVSEMTKEEIEDAGINTSDPNNQHVFKYEVTLVFTDGVEHYTVPSITYKNENGDVAGGSFGNRPVEPGKTASFDVPELHTKVVYVNEFLYIVIQGEAKWQKEMFHAQLVVANATQTDTMENVTATLSLPDGLSLASMKQGAQEASQDLGTVDKMSTKTVDWYICGDEEGDYNLEASLTGTFEPLGTPFEYTFKTEDPLHVYAGSDMQLTVHISDAAYHGEPYTMIFELENVSDHNIYDVTHEVKSVEQYEVTKYAWIEDGETIKTEEEFNRLTSEYVGEEGSISKEVFRPGEKLAVLVKTDIAWTSPLLELKNNASDLNAVLKLVSKLVPPAQPVSKALSLLGYIDVRYYLTDTIVQTLEGSTAQIPVVFDVEHHAGVKLTDKFIEELVGKAWGKVSDKGLTLLAGDKETKTIYDLFVSMFKGTSTLVEAEPFDPDTEYFAWVESADGSSNVIQLSADGAQTDENGRLVLKGTQEISVDALNSGTAFLVIEDQFGNVTKKEFAVAEEFPGYDKIMDGLKDPTGFLGFEDALLPSNMQVTEYLDDMLEELGFDLYYDGKPLELGEMIPNGAVICDPESGEEVMVLVPGDTNSDADIDVRDAYVMVDAGTTRALSEAQAKAGEITGDGVVDRTDALELLDYLTDTGINSRSRVMALAEASAGELSGTVSLADLTAGYESVRGIQVDFLDVAAAGLTDVSVSNSIEAEDFSRSVYNAGGDYARTIAASFDGNLDTSKGQIILTCNGAAGEVTLPARVYIQTDDGAVVSELTQVTVNLSADVDPEPEPDPEPGDELEQEKDNLDSALDAFEGTLGQSAIPEDKKDEFTQKVEEIRDQLESAQDAETIADLMQQLEDLKDAYQDEVDAVEDDPQKPSTDPSKPGDDGNKGDGDQSDSQESDGEDANAVPDAGEPLLMTVMPYALAAVGAAMTGVAVRRRNR